MASNEPSDLDLRSLPFGLNLLLTPLNGTINGCIQVQRQNSLFQKLWGERIKVFNLSIRTVSPIWSHNSLFKLEGNVCKDIQWMILTNHAFSRKFDENRINNKKKSFGLKSAKMLILAPPFWIFARLHGWKGNLFKWEMGMGWREGWGWGLDIHSKEISWHENINLTFIANSEDPDVTARMRSLLLVFAVRACSEGTFLFGVAHMSGDWTRAANNRTPSMSWKSYELVLTIND